MTIEEAQKRLNIEADFLPADASNRPGTPVRPDFLTIHNTANPGADARAHGRYMKSAEAKRRRVSWHYSVDNLRVVKHLPLSEIGWHAGKGNAVSVGIEICEFDDTTKQDAANERAALLCAVLMHALNIPAARIVTHRHWTRKTCPRKLLNQPGGFAVFRARCETFRKEIKP
jgi:N-acetylmuramoyl-L-alanine amidase